MQCITVLLLTLGVASAYISDIVVSSKPKDLVFDSFASAVKWTAVDKVSGKTCVIFAADSINGKLNIQTTENTTETVTFTIGNATNVNGDCQGKYGDNPSNNLEISFFPDGAMPASATEGQPWKLSLWFPVPEDTTMATFKLADWKLETSPGGPFNSTTQVFTKSATSDLDVHASGTNGFKCSTTALPLSDDSTIELKEARVIANARLEKDEFPADQAFEQCLLDSRTSDIVPIVVGACLAGLVAVVLIAYLVGRARAKRQGYASV